MTSGENGNTAAHSGNTSQKRRKSRRPVVLAATVFLIVILTLFILALILALTVLKPKHPETKIVSVSVEGVAPRVSFPAIQVQLNVTLNLTILVRNRNHASFKHGYGETLLLYRSGQVGDAQLDPGEVPAMGSSIMGCRLTLEVDRFGSGSNLMSLVNDLAQGQIPVATSTRIPGKVSFLKIFKKHVVTTSYCQIVISFPDFKIKSQDCKYHTKL